jgi:hypothetical protein
MRGATPLLDSSVALFGLPQARWPVTFWPPFNHPSATQSPLLEALLGPFSCIHQKVRAQEKVGVHAIGHLILNPSTTRLDYSI